MIAALIKNTRIVSRATILRLGIVILLANSALHAEYINTASSWDGTSYIYPFGEINTASYGQTITTGSTETFLNGFSFLVQTTTLNPSQFEAFVMEWDTVGSMVKGPVLYQSPMVIHNQSNGFDQITVNPNVNLAPNTKYAIFFSASNVFDGLLDEARFANTGDLYAGGEFIYQNNGSNFGQLSTSDWNTTFIGSGDLAFTATLVSVPEPTSVLLMSIGIGGLALRFQRNKSRN